MNVFRGSSYQESIVDVVSLKEAARDLERGNRLRSSGRGDNSLASSQRQDDTSAGQSSLISALLRLNHRRSTAVIISLILVLGVISSAALLTIGISSARSQQETQFKRSASELVQRIQVRFAQYENAAAMVHNFCRSRTFTRGDFRQLYEYLVNAGLDFKAVQFDPNITREERPQYEEEAFQFYNTSYPHVQYRGFVGFEQGISGGLQPRSEQDFYFPIHYMEPVVGNEAAIDLDYYSHESRRQALTYSLTNGLPSATERLVLVQVEGSTDRCGAAGKASYGVVLFHPGVDTTSSDDVWPKDVASVVICVPSLLASASEGHSINAAAYLYDASGSSGNSDLVYLGGVIADGKTDDLEFLSEVGIGELEDQRRYFYSRDMKITNKQWRVAVVPLKGAYEPSLVFVILGGIITLMASGFLAFWVYNSNKRVTRFNAVKAEAESEKASLILENARQATKAERELNDFIGHEVRNPVSAAMTACSFVKSAVNKPNPMADAESRESVKEDVEIIDNSLKFVNDLLRNMLDMHRASNKQLKVKMAPVDVLHDVLEPVGGMLHQRNSRYEVQVDCPDNLFIMADSLRLKQVILNLGRNSSKFISEGFIRLSAAEVDGMVQLTVDDSGSGIPKEKQDKLFSKFQESLDVLSQGTGIGLFLCKNLTELMGGKIYLDETYTSGLEGSPGTRFIIDMQAPALEPPGETGSHYTKDGESMTADRSGVFTEGKRALPDSCSVLFVDDDSILRKLFCRSIKYVAPQWKVREAASGEAALRLIETSDFDLIFVDMYMASVEKQLLGTETVVEMRTRGLNCRIIGLSANDKEKEFLEAGSDAFCFKPFPCEKAALRDELRRVLFCGTEKLPESDRIAG